MGDTLVGMVDTLVGRRDTGVGLSTGVGIV